MPAQVVDFSCLPGARRLAISGATTVLVVVAWGQAQVICLAKVEGFPAGLGTWLGEFLPLGDPTRLVIDNSPQLVIVILRTLAVGALAAGATQPRHLVDLVEAKRESTQA